MTPLRAARTLAAFISGAVRPATLPGKLLLSHLSVASLGLMALTIAFLATDMLKGTIGNLVSNASPKAVASAMAMSGVQRSMAWLRLSFSGEMFTASRRRAWAEEIWPSISTLASLAGKDDREYLDEITAMAKQLEVAQWWVEEAVASVGNEPAHWKLMEEISPIHDNLLATLDRLAEDFEKAGSGDSFTKTVISLRSGISTTYFGMHDFLDTAEEWTERDILNSLSRAREANRSLSAPPVYDDSHMKETISWIKTEFAVYDGLMTEAMAERRKLDWNKARWMMETEVIPLTRRVTQGLSLISLKYSEDMERQAKAAEFMSRLVTGLIFLLMAVMIVVAVGMSRRNSARITMPVAALSRAAGEMAKGGEAHDIPVTSDDEMGSLTKTFNKMRAALEEKEIALRKRAEDLEKANNEMESFIYSVSHDLKVPMITIQGMAKLLEREVGHGVSKEARTYFNYIFGASTTMSDLLDDLLEMSRVGRIDVNPDIVDMNEMAEKVFAEAEALSQKRGIRFEAQPDMPWARANKKRIYQVMSNLVFNAVKFMPAYVEKPIVRVGVRPGAPDGMIEFFVSDNGAGIDPKYQEKIFTLFTRLHGKEIEGTGMGLAFVKKILENMGGNIRVDSEPGMGAAFCFTLPKALEGKET